MSENKKVVLAYSGGLDTTCILFWLKEQGYDVICYTADVGQRDDFEQVKKQAIELGAVKAVIDDRKKEFVEDFIYPSLAYGGIYQSRYLLGTSLARPCIAKGIIEVAKAEKAGFISHGATGKGNDQVRFELTCASLDPTIQCIAPWRLPDFYNRFKGRIDLMDYAKQNGFQTPATPKAPYSMDANMMHISFESGILEDPLSPAPMDMFQMTANADQWPDKPEKLTIDFKAGLPVKVTNESTGEEVSDSVHMFDYLNVVAGKHGVGRIDIIEDRFIGMKSRGVYETPGGTVLYEAARDLEVLCLDREVNKVKSSLAQVFSEKVYYGLWFSPEGQYVRTCLDLSQRLVNGLVKLELFKGKVYIVGRKADKSLYDQELVSMDVQGNFTPIHSEGFIRTQAIRLNTFRFVYDKCPYSGKPWGQS
ncbi:Argininosuccinate synthase [Halotydeus destructor]|nr:Argininosuccinate synthase [Halotydeus destructor]